MKPAIITRWISPAFSIRFPEYFVTHPKYASPTRSFPYSRLSSLLTGVVA